MQEQLLARSVSYRLSSSRLARDIRLSLVRVVLLDVSSADRHNLQPLLSDQILFHPGVLSHPIKLSLGQLSPNL